MRSLPAFAILAGAALAAHAPPVRAQGADRIDCRFVSFVRCSPTRQCRTEEPNEGERTLTFAIDFRAKTLRVQHHATTLSTIPIHRVWNEGAKRLFTVADPDDQPYELTGTTLVFPNDTSGSKSILECVPAL